MRSELGNCFPLGGYCFNAVSDEICEALHNAYNKGRRDGIVKGIAYEADKIKQGR